MITYEQLADWVLANRSGNAFRDYSKSDIVAEIMDRVNYDLVWYHESDGKLNGIVTADELDGPIIFVRNALVTTHVAMRDFLGRYSMTYKGIPLYYDHRGKRRTINPLRALSYGRT